MELVYTYIYIYGDSWRDLDVTDTLLTSGISTHKHNCSLLHFRHNVKVHFCPAFSDTRKNTAVFNVPELRHIIIIIINIPCPYFTAVQPVLRTVPVCLTDQALRIHCCAKNILAIRHVFSITAFCVRIYREGLTASSYRLSCNLFGAIPVVGPHEIVFG